MSVAGYIGKNVKVPGKLRRDVLDNGDARKEKELKSPELERETKAYESVEEYDPMPLRSHCRLGGPIAKLRLIGNRLGVRPAPEQRGTDPGRMPP